MSQTRFLRKRHPPSNVPPLGIDSIFPQPQGTQEGNATTSNGLCSSTVETRRKERNTEINNDSMTNIASNVTVNNYDKAKEDQEFLHQVRGYEKPS